MRVASCFVMPLPYMFSIALISSAPYPSCCPIGSGAGGILKCGGGAPLSCARPRFVHMLMISPPFGQSKSIHVYRRCLNLFEYFRIIFFIPLDYTCYTRYSVITVKEVMNMPMTPKEMVKLLESNGFEYIRSNGSHRFYRNSETGKTTTVPFHNKTLKQGTEKSILKQAGLK